MRKRKGLDYQTRTAEKQAAEEQEKISIYKCLKVLCNHSVNQFTEPSDSVYSQQKWQLNMKQGECEERKWRKKNDDKRERRMEGRWSKKVDKWWLFCGSFVTVYQNVPIEKKWSKEVNGLWLVAY